MLPPPRPAPLLRKLSAAVGTAGSALLDGDAAAAVTSPFLLRCRELLPGVPLLRSGARPAAPRGGVPLRVAAVAAALRPSRRRGPLDLLAAVSGLLAALEDRAAAAAAAIPTEESLRLRPLRPSVSLLPERLDERPAAGFASASNSPSVLGVSTGLLLLLLPAAVAARLRVPIRGPSSAAAAAAVAPCLPFTPEETRLLPTVR